MITLPNKTRTSFAGGFTLLELLITLLVVGIVAAWGLPNFQALGERTAQTSAVTRLQSAFSLARNTAISQGHPLTLCPADKKRRACTNNWSGELILVRGDKTESIATNDILRIFPGQQGNHIRYSRGWSRILYSPLGYTQGYNGSFTLCSSRRTEGGSEGKKLVLSQLGRLRVDEAPIDC